MQLVKSTAIADVYLWNLRCCALD